MPYDFGNVDFCRLNEMRKIPINHARLPSRSNFQMQYANAKLKERNILVHFILIYYFVFLLLLPLPLPLL